MSAQENRIIGKLDRDRGKATLTARTLQVRELAKASINCAVMDMPEADRAEYMSASIRHLRTLYGAGEGETEAVALFGSLAWSATLQTRRVAAQANAEKVFAANDGPPTIKHALISALRQPEHAAPCLRPIADELEREE